MNLTNILSFIAILISYSSYSQSKSSNLILIIDNKIVTQNIELVFQSDDFMSNKVQYSLGKELSLDEALLKNENIILNFSYDELNKGVVKTYKYDIDFKAGWLKNTNYLIVRIYNLDKKQFKRAFCNEHKNYAIEVQNQVYTESNVLCKKLNKL